MRSFAQVPFGIVPPKTTFMVSGTRSQSFPVRSTPDMSDDPMPNAKTFSAP